MSSSFRFLSTFPLRGTSHLTPHVGADSLISIHVPLAGNVRCWSWPCARIRHFYPRSPCGERRRSDGAGQIPPEISIHVPLAGNVSVVSLSVQALKISIHVPLAGNVARSSRSQSGQRLISIHVPLAGNVAHRLSLHSGHGISIHVPLAGNVPLKFGSPLLL